MTELHKSSSAFYGREHQENLLEFYYEGKVEGTYSYKRIKLAEQLVDDSTRRFFASTPKSEINIVDIGCSIRTFAIHFSKQGFKSAGVDFDSAAIEIATELNAKEGSNATFLQKDVADIENEIGKVDIAVCMDIFEHLHDDELGSLFASIKRRMSDRGCLVFHTLPCEFDYLFWNRKKGIVQFPILLWPFKALPERWFSKLVRMYALVIDTGMVCFLDKTYKQHIKKFHHCNPLTMDRLADIFERAGYELMSLETGFVDDQFKVKDKKYFNKHSITHRSLFGIAVPRR